MAAAARADEPAAQVDPTTLSTAVIDGSSAYSPAELFTVYRDQLGRPITGASARAILSQIEALYLRDGYSRPEIAFDDELVSHGVLRISVFEPQITQVVLSGDPGPYAAKLEQLGAQLRERVPLRPAELRAILQRARELPGLTIDVTTRRDETRRNAYALTIDAEYKPVEGLIELSNRGTREIGPSFAFGRLVGNNLFGLGERIGLMYSGALEHEEYHGAGLFLDLPIAHGDTHVTASSFVSDAAPTERPDRDIDYERERSSLRAVTTFGEADTRLAVSAGLDFDDLEIMLDAQRLRIERLRVGELGARLSGRIGAQSQYLVAMQVRQGLDGLGSTLDASDLRNDRRRKDFVLTRLQLTYLRRFAERWNVRLDALGQQSAYVLPDAERYKIGGERLGRGFEVTEIAGDEGIGGKAELRRQIGAASAARISAYGFYDFAAAWKQDIQGRRSATTAGIGLAFEYRRLNSYIEVAKPLTGADVEGDRDAKVFAEVRLKL